MAVTVVATAGSASANSYATVAEADTYLEGRLDADAWGSLTDAQKGRQLIQATSMIDSLILYGAQHEDAADASCPLHFPTEGCEDSDGTAIIPTDVRDACTELALGIVRSASGPSELSTLQAAGITSMTEGALSVSFDKSGATMTQRAWAAAPEARRLLNKETSYNDYQGWLIRSAARVVTL